MLYHRLALALLFTLPGLSLLGCDCATIQQSDRLENVRKGNYPAILIGRVLSKAGVAAQSVSTLRGFRGVEAGQTVYLDSLNSCSAALRPGIYLIYASEQRDSLLNVSQCGGSRELRPDTYGFSPRLATNDFASFLQEGVDAQDGTISQLESLYPTHSDSERSYTWAFIFLAAVFGVLIFYRFI